MRKKVDINRRLITTLAIVAVSLVIHSIMRPEWSWGSPSCFFFLFIALFVATVVYGFVENKTEDGYIGFTFISMMLCSGSLVLTLVVWLVSVIRH